MEPMIYINNWLLILSYNNMYEMFTTIIINIIRYCYYYYIIAIIINYDKNSIVRCKIILMDRQKWHWFIIYPKSSQN